MTHPAGRLTVAGLLIALGAACGTRDAASVCGPVERIVEPGNIHVLPGTEVTYGSSPPTSGPHQVPAPEPGAYRSPIAEPLQVGAVESGHVLIQYGPETEADDVAILEALAGDGVLVAPGVRPFDDGATVAFTAWSKRQLCDGIDLEAAETFVADHVGVFFTNHD